MVGDLDSTRGAHAKSPEEPASRQLKFCSVAVNFRQSPERSTGLVTEFKRCRGVSRLGWAADSCPSVYRRLARRPWRRCCGHRRRNMTANARPLNTVKGTTKPVGSTRASKGVEKTATIEIRFSATGGRERQYAKGEPHWPREDCSWRLAAGCVRRRHPHNIEPGHGLVMVHGLTRL